MIEDNSAPWLARRRYQDSRLLLEPILGIKPKGGEEEDSLHFVSLDTPPSSLAKLITAGIYRLFSALPFV
jgi:hypothetical protein